MKIILFDGVCNLCHASVQFIIQRDPQEVFRFASLQSNVGQTLAQKLSLPSVDSVILLEGNRYYTKSSAALRICRQLTGFWGILYIFMIVPKPFRDLIYDWIANHRYQWFGKRESCLIPTPHIRERFLDS
ncbi:putative DCC family thiol-disulfide oxidoreductase YuxK [Anoxybacillus tepidamans]|uniref:Putative DCC family thiol-disulfide oxidoreductase YuxK n=1 Tax=Anoxybacteroides tepidamans TaxID=265948 RepID=A0A7W8MT65_9BACL|nr:thiol-disulfide oxidoreductase DCC family protein [Anoxybacillus tepidamans]MBB5323097.1 putative DCC family thiol-disulfide oxidoreductase YuxK [Anoxybacillus tepidamans]